MCGTGGLWSISVPSSQYCSEPKSALKYKVFFKVVSFKNCFSPAPAPQTAWEQPSATPPAFRQEAVP